MIIQIGEILQLEVQLFLIQTRICFKKIFNVCFLKFCWMKNSSKYNTENKLEHSSQGTLKEEAGGVIESILSAKNL